MEKYKCGHDSEGIMVVENPEQVNLNATTSKSAAKIYSYLVWAHSVGIFGTKEVCLNCWEKKPKAIYNCAICGKTCVDLYDGMNEDESNRRIWCNECVKKKWDKRSKQ